MTVIRIGPHTELNIFVIEGNTEPDRQTEHRMAHRRIVAEHQDQPDWPGVRAWRQPILGSQPRP
jgi:hypothetical protein